MAVKPVGDTVAVRFIELSEEDLEQRREAWRQPGPPPKEFEEPILGLVIGVGTETTRKGFKKGDAVLLRPHVVNAPELSDGIYAVDQYAVMAVVTE